MSEERLTTEDVRYRCGSIGYDEEFFEEYAVQFDAWLAEHDAQVLRRAANAIGDTMASSDFLADEMSDAALFWVVQWLRSRADAMTRQADAPAADDEPWECQHQPRCADAACSHNPAMRRWVSGKAADDEGGRRALPEGAHAATWPGGGCQCFCAIGHDHDADDEGGQE